MARQRGLGCAELTRSAEFLTDLRQDAAVLARSYGLSASQADDFAQTLAILISSRWGGEQPYVHKSAYIDAKHLAVYTAFLRAKQTAPNVRAAAQQVSEEIGYGVAQIFRIVSNLKNTAHKVASGHG